jgi:hypothetical protein
MKVIHNKNSFVTTVVYEKKDKYIYIPNSSNLLLNLVIFILYKESYIFGETRKIRLYDILF